VYLSKLTTKFYKSFLNSPLPVFSSILPNYECSIFNIKYLNANSYELFKNFCFYTYSMISLRKKNFSIYMLRYFCEPDNALSAFEEESD